jgi:hypothetical protein
MDEIKEGSVVKREMSTKVKEIGAAGSRILEFVASTETPDRSNDIIEVNGWKVDNWNKNPVFPIFHDYYRLPVGKGMSATKDARAKALVIRVYFPTVAELCSDPSHPSDEALFVDTVYNMYKQGMLNAVSVGFKPVKFKTRDDDSVLEKPEWQRGYRFIETELLEVSAVIVPCNPDALVSMRGMKSYDPKGIELIEKEIAKATAPQGDKSKTAEEQESLFGEEEDVDVDEKTLKALEERVLKRLEDREVKAGSKFSKETRDAISKVVEAMDASHKAIRACSKTLASMIAEPEDEKPAEEKPAEEKPEDDDEKAGDAEVKKTITEVVKELDFATASLADAASMFA